MSPRTPAKDVGLVVIWRDMEIQPQDKLTEQLIKRSISPRPLNLRGRELCSSNFLVRNPDLLVLANAIGVL